jgi:geranylgeranyl diphosphate synthase type I
VPQAVNAGDAMFTQAHLALLELRYSHPAETVLAASQILQETCLALTQGQYLDLSYESRLDLGEDDYFPMIQGKTAALLAACTELGALAGHASQEIQEHYRCFGHNLGLAFQALDDLLGIWGDAELTGKSAESDLVAGKKSLPVLYGLHRNGAFAERWKKGPILASEVQVVADQLARDGAREYTEKKAAQLTDAALASLEAARTQGTAGLALTELTCRLLNRQS